MKIDHVTAVVADAEIAAEALERLLGQGPVARVSLPGMCIRSFRIGDAEIHLNAPTGPGPIDEHHRRHGPGYHHLALRVEDLDALLAELAGRGFVALGTPVATAPGLREIFLDPQTTGGVLVQLVERRVVEQGSYTVDAEAVARLAGLIDSGERKT
jgi:catechol 2,3-dioxygenase-like lactoylglutathione lyase family enzyme